MNAASELIDAMLRTSTRITTLSAEHSAKAQNEDLTMWERAHHLSIMEGLGAALEILSQELQSVDATRRAEKNR